MDRFPSESLFGNSKYFHSQSGSVTTDGLVLDAEMLDHAMAGNTSKDWGFAPDSGIVLVASRIITTWMPQTRDEQYIFDRFAWNNQEKTGVDLFSFEYYVGLVDARPKTAGISDIRKSNQISLAGDPSCFAHFTFTGGIIPNRSRHDQAHFCIEIDEIFTVREKRRQGYGSLMATTIGIITSRFIKRFEDMNVGSGTEVHSSLDFHATGEAGLSISNKLLDGFNYRQIDAQNAAKKTGICTTDKTR